MYSCAALSTIQKFISSHFYQYSKAMYMFTFVTMSFTQVYTPSPFRIATAVSLKLQ